MKIHNFTTELVGVTEIKENKILIKFNKNITKAKKRQYLTLAKGNW